MVKAVGAVMTGFACGYMGIRMSMSLKKRVKSLEDIYTSLEMLESEISFSVSRLREAFCHIDRNGIFADAAEEMTRCGVKTAMEKSLNKNREKLCLSEADCEIILMLSDSLGKTDVQDQIKSIRYAKSMIASQQDTAKNEYARTGKLYRSGGVLIGLMIVVVLA